MTTTNIAPGAHATPSYGRFAQPTQHDQRGTVWQNDWREVAGRLLTHLDEETTDSLPSTHTVSVTDYLDRDRWQREVDVLFRRGPVVVAMSAHIPAPGAYRAIEIAGVPVLTVRQPSGGVKASIIHGQNGLAGI